jgi:hypothetical protein
MHANHFPANLVSTVSAVSPSCIIHLMPAHLYIFINAMVPPKCPLPSCDGGLTFSQTIGSRVAFLSQAPVARACKASYSGGRGQEDCG